ncbi:MAG: phosphomannomutase [Gammaproteobacteria bacterium]|jgi:phosphomannomutase|nr:phosphomannomutase [Gammaproteobacteria bacterium]MBT3987752.1 phosphomannomutase [Gammaproteobacteria bacterium]MBT4256402.1 phosphomannomutase [Gammaproteobacteria bacterium]MBT4583234.1 phosphomannomutase [Gammaproteobacteria bacterium]MBT4657408.1 phosphomannomutase [Gammaproteobacteria bacterium]
MNEELSCFKAYDIRGRVPDQLNEDISYRIGRAYAEFLKPKTVVVGFDIRLSSQALCAALTRGLTDAGVDVINIGQCGTEEIYFATSHLQTDGGIVVTASHNPADYNGMKFVREASKPISGDTGLNKIRQLAEENNFAEINEPGAISFADIQAAYVNHLLAYVEIKKLKPLKIVCNAGNGGAGQTIDAIQQFLPVEFVKIHHEPDGNFPNGVPNPLLEENRQPTIDAIVEHGADLGIAWDGDFDRCFFFDEAGRFIEGYYIVGLLAQSFISKEPGAKIVHDPRLTWNTREIVEQGGGEAVLCKTGHAFIKERMRSEDAIYGGEMSAHHYFRDFFYCDSGMVPWLLVLGLMSASDKKLSELVDERMQAYPASGEINRRIEEPAALLDKIEKEYTSKANSVDHTDGLSVEFDDWRFNIRMSNTEPVVRLNVEARGDSFLMEERTRELLAYMD